MAPLLYMGTLGVELKDFGFYQGAMAGVFSVLSLASGFFIRRYGSKHCFRFGLGALSAFIILALGLLVTGIQNPLVITGICIIQAAGMIWPINMIWPISLEAVPGAKARMSALICGTRMLLTAISIQIVSHFYHNHFFPIGAAMILFILMGFWGIYLLYRHYHLGSFLNKKTLEEDAANTHEVPLH
jgi:DHA1 family bicyclomycin/chloramphenicol resistance-like MFS transporter